jgi:hypothetical protein
LDPVSFVGLAGIPFIVALVQLLKNTWPTIPSHYWPAIVLLVSVILNLALAWQLAGNLGTAVLVGIVTGLSASGLYSWATTTGPGPKP